MINEHASRLSWWIVAILAIIALVLIGVIGTHNHVTQFSGSWSAFSPSTWIAPTPRALASLVGIAIVLDLYISYMAALKKGHLDKYVGQFILSSILKVGFYVFFLYGLGYNGSIGSMFALAGLAIMLAWSFLTSHGTSPLMAWVHALILVFVIFLIVMVASSGVTIWPTY